MWEVLELKRRYDDHFNFFTILIGSVKISVVVINFQNCNKTVKGVSVSLSVLLPGTVVLAQHSAWCGALPGTDSTSN